MIRYLTLFTALLLTSQSSEAQPTAKPATVRELLA